MDTTSHQTVKLSRGKHRTPDDGACVMELSSMLAGERFTDAPQAVCPVIAGFLRAYNDTIDDRRRQDLYGLASEVVGTRGGEAVARERSGILRAWALDHLVGGLRAFGFRRLIVRHAHPARLAHLVGARAGTLARKQPGDELHREVLALVGRLVELRERTAVPATTKVCAGAPEAELALD